MNIYWSDILSLIYNSVLHERVDVLTVEARFGDLVVPGLNCMGQSFLLSRSLGAPAVVDILAAVQAARMSEHKSS